MVDISVQIEGQNGLNWPLWKQLVSEVEALGFVGLYRSDHFTNAGPIEQVPDMDALELIVSLSYLADHTQKIEFGPLVSPVSFRDPVMLARQALVLDDLSNGRMVLGVGAGWQDREHHIFGYTLGDVPTRMRRYAEALEIISTLLRSDKPFTFEGDFYHLHDALLLPRPQRPGGPRLLVGGNGLKYTLPLAARYADVWNGTFLEPDAFRERSQQLDALLAKEGRDPKSVRRSLMAPVQEAGTPEQIIAKIQQYGEAGVEEIMLWWPSTTDIEGLRTFAHTILPHI